MLQFRYYIIGSNTKEVLSFYIIKPCLADIHHSWAHMIFVMMCMKNYPQIVFLVTEKSMMSCSEQVSRVC